MRPIVFHLPGDEVFTERLVRALRAERAALALHRFPDGESLVRLDADVTGRTVVLTCSLARPDEKTLPLLFAAAFALYAGIVFLALVVPSRSRSPLRMVGANGRSFGIDDAGAGRPMGVLSADPAGVSTRGAGYRLGRMAERCFSITGRAGRRRFMISRIPAPTRTFGSPSRR